MLFVGGFITEDEKGKKKKKRKTKKACFVLFCLGFSFPFKIPAITGQIIEKCCSNLLHGYYWVIFVLKFTFNSLTNFTDLIKNGIREIS